MAAGLPRRALLGAAAAALAAPALAQAPAQSAWPNRPIRIVVTLSPGSASDLLARMLAEEISRDLRQQVIVENRPGAGGNIGAAMIARARPDGYNLIMVAPAHTVNATLYPNPGYEPIKDFEPVGQVTNMTNMVVAHPSFPAKTIGELIEILFSLMSASSSPTIW